MMRFRLPAVAAAVAAAVTLSVALAASAPAPAAAQSTSEPWPKPKQMKFTDVNGAACINAWWVSGTKDGRYVWSDKIACCPPAPPAKTMKVWRGNRRCTSRWVVADRELNGDRNCVWKWHDSTWCPPEPTCPPMPMEMKTRWVKATGERCTKTWKACGKKMSWGKCTWKGCDYVKCLPPCPKPMAKTMRIDTPTRVCVDNWWPTKLSVDKRDDLMHCKWAWADHKQCYCKDGNNATWKKC